MLTDPIFNGPKKGRWPKDERKRQQRRYELNAAREARKALERRLYGTLGPASPVRHIDPKTYKID